jgi:hypothetical protein
MMQDGCDRSRFPVFRVNVFAEADARIAPGQGVLYRRTVKEFDMYREFSSIAGAVAIADQRFGRIPITALDRCHFANGRGNTNVEGIPQFTVNGRWSISCRSYGSACTHHMIVRDGVGVFKGILLRATG